MSEKIQDEYQLAMDFIKRCEATKEKNSQSQDKIVIAIASGLFGLLLTLFDKGLLEQSQSCIFKALIASNAATIILALLSFSIANKSIDTKIKHYIYLKKEINYWDVVTKIFNAGYLITTFVTVAIVVKILWNII